MGSRARGLVFGVLLGGMMAALFALGIMSLTWMAAVAGSDRPREDASLAQDRRATERR